MTCLIGYSSHEYFFLWEGYTNMYTNVHTKLISGGASVPGVHTLFEILFHCLTL